MSVQWPNTIRTAAVSGGLWLLVALAAAGEGAAVSSGPTRLENCRPRLFFRPAAWPGGRSVAQLREISKTAPFNDRLRLLRTTRANLALKWLISGDERDGAAALRALLDFDARLATSSEGVELLDVALAYDWLHTWEGFAARDKALVEERMLALAGAMRAALTDEGAHIFHTRMYSWMAGVGLAGLALHDARPEGAALFEFARRYYEERLLPARALQDGTMHNGLSYGPNYIMFPLLQFLLGARSGANLDYFHTARAADSDWLRATAPFLIHAVQPDLRHVKFADVATDDPAKQFRFMLDILANEYRDGQAAELARLIGERYRTSGYHAEWIYLFFAFHDPTVAPRPLAEMPTARLFSPLGTGHLFMRSDWSEAATLVHFRCGDYFENHGHFDQGAFTIFRRGELALKGGSYASAFDSEHRHHYFKQAISANTVVFSDPSDPLDAGRQRQIHYQSAGTPADYAAHKLPGAQPRVECGDILAFDAAAWATCTISNFHHLAADVTAAWDASKVKRHLRQLAFVDGRHLVVVDETETATPAIRARWLLHTAVAPRPPVAGASAWEVNLTNSVLFVQMPIPTAPRVTLIGGAGREFEVNGVNHGMIGRQGQPVKPPPSAGAWRMELEWPEPAGKRLFVAVLTADTAGARAPAVAADFKDGALVVKIGMDEVRFLKVRR
jgi:hypothetical protein